MLDFLLISCYCLFMRLRHPPSTAAGARPVRKKRCRIFPLRSFFAYRPPFCCALQRLAGWLMLFSRPVMHAHCTSSPAAWLASSPSQAMHSKHDEVFAGTSAMLKSSRAPHPQQRTSRLR
ncbi:hypothetical protein Hsc_0762 [Herbaspirillum seropedicae]|nr:hypothetical protein Hsc_0762 [Herbaspirillum seropedicae]